MTSTALRPTSVLPALQALAEPNRFQIVEALRAGERCVCELQDTLDVSQSLLSHHLRALREAGLVADRREGRWVHYSLVPDALSALEGFLAALRTDAATAPPHPSCCP
ncbi:MAG: metalloregulator ArsR/SmtB family transcription factor [Gemmatimonadota bacterium]|jgi:ArsR family transcriptional regulator